MTIDKITLAEWRIGDLERDLAHASQNLSLAQAEVENASAKLKAAKANLSFLRRKNRG
jgi:hypothetical protein